MLAANPTLDAVTTRLVAAGCVAADEEAALFIAAAPDAVTLEAWLSRRELGEPPGWITGQVRFCERVLQLSPGVYVPRVQSEELARRAAALLPERGRAVDICTGAGAIAAHLKAAVPTALVIGVDIDARAAACARRNGVLSVAGDGAEPIRGDASFDIVTAVTPYVPTDDIRLLPADVQRHEPHVALDGGPDGLTIVRRVVAAATRLLRPGGSLLIEVGADQDRSLAPTFAANGFANVTVWRDDDDDVRGVAAQLDGYSSG